MERISDRIIFIEEEEIADVLSFIKNSDYETVYDSVPEGIRIREVIYQEYNKNYYGLDYRQKKDFMNCFLHFESIGVLDEDVRALGTFIKCFAEQSISVIVLEEKQLQWDEERSSYKYCGQMEQVPEILLVPYFLYYNVKCYYQDSVIPMMSQFECADFCNRNIADCDLAYNVIPRLRRNGVFTLVISNINHELDKIERQHQIHSDNETREKRLIGAFGIKGNEKEKVCGLLKEWYDMQIYSYHSYFRYRNNKGHYFNISNGERMTIGNPKVFDHTCWIFGPCITFGSYVDDAHTLASFLRKKLSFAYHVRNIYAWFPVMNFTVRDYIFKRGDILIIYPNNPEIYRQAGIKTFSTVRAYKECDNFENHLIDNCLQHVDSYLTEKIADIILEAMCKEGFPVFDESLAKKDVGDEVVATSGKVGELASEVCFGRRYKTDIPLQLKQWLCDVKQYGGELFEKTGSIVMNCNPFTLGHRYLIERACMQVDRLIIFVVEEDKSLFRFQDRIEMVRLGTADLKKVVVIPSGRYIISAQTLPGYFEKDDNPNVVFDVMDDLDLFATVICSELNISVRFAGEEPIDRYTREYNCAMSNILPAHGIEFVEIPRKEQGGNVISASRVRKLISEKRGKEIKELVMPEIYAFLEEQNII